ncbi:hypothetical protein [Pseudolactococcus reticulitermitis]|nr:hypothetical protein [Lactococcus reticulitermitis]
MTHTLEPWMPVGATKPKDDIAKIATEIGWNRLEIDRATQETTADNLVSNLTASDIVVHQFPSYLSLAFEENFQQAVQETGAKFIILIHDFEPLRLSARQDSDREYALLNRADGLIVHTTEMAKALNIPIPTFILGLFDYLTDSQIPDRNPSQNLIFAGTLTKAPWLKNFPLPIKVFGNLPRKWSPADLAPTLKLQDILPQDSAPAELPDGIGLVWDTDDTENTHYQTYQRLNSPHKLSLYLAAELPVILPSFSPFADFITQHHLGISLDDLSQLPLTFDYDPIMGKKIGHALRHGNHTKKLLQELEQFYETK